MLSIQKAIKDKKKIKVKMRGVWVLFYPYVFPCICCGIPNIVIIALAELPVLRTDLKVFHPLNFFSLSWQLGFEDQPPWVASRDRRAMHAHVSSYSTGCTFKSAPGLYPSRRCAARACFS